MTSRLTSGTTLTPRQLKIFLSHMNNEEELSGCGGGACTIFKMISSCTKSYLFKVLARYFVPFLLAKEGYFFWRKAYSSRIASATDFLLLISSWLLVNSGRNTQRNDTGSGESNHAALLRICYSLFTYWRLLWVQVSQEWLCPWGRPLRLCQRPSDPILSPRRVSFGLAMAKHSAWEKL